MKTRFKSTRGFTLLEVMVAIAILGIAMLGLLGLHHQSLQSVIRAQDTTRAAMLAQAVITQAELERFPDPGTTRGDFGGLFQEKYPNFRWERTVQASGDFPDIRKVRVVVFFGPHMARTFAVTEFLHSPMPQNGTAPQQ